MKRDDQVQVWGDGPHEGDRRGPERRVFEGSVEAVGKRRIIVRRPGMPWREKDTFAFDATTGRAIQNNSAMFLKLDEPALWSNRGRGPEAGDFAREAKDGTPLQYWPNRKCCTSDQGCEICQQYKCIKCKRWRPWSFGGADNMPLHCDACWKPPVEDGGPDAP